MSATLNKDLDEARLELAKAQAQKKRELRKVGKGGNKGGVGRIRCRRRAATRRREFRERGGVGRVRQGEGGPASGEVRRASRNAKRLKKNYERRRPREKKRRRKAAGSAQKKKKKKKPKPGPIDSVLMEKTLSRLHAYVFEDREHR